MTEIERTYIIPLRKGVMKAPKYMRAHKAIIVLRQFLQRHMKSKEVKIGPYLNSKILEHGRKNVPHHVEVKVIKNKDGIVKAEYAKTKNLDFLKPKKEEKEEEIKIKIPGLGKKETLETTVTPKEKPESKELTEKEKKEILKHPEEKEKKEKYPETKYISKEEEIKVKEDQVYGRLGSKKTKVKEKKK